MREKGGHWSCVIYMCGDLACNSHQKEQVRCLQFYHSEDMQHVQTMCEMGISRSERNYGNMHYSNVSRLMRVS